MQKKHHGFRFVAYLSPPPANVGYGIYEHNKNYIDEEHYRDMIDCGFDRAIGLFENRVPHYLAGMAEAEKAGMDYLVRDQFPEGSLEGIIDDLKKSGKSARQLLEEKGPDIEERFDQYVRQPAFSGILASDEPSANKFEAIRQTQDWFLKRYPGKEYLINLLPTYANGEQLSGVKDTKVFDYEKEYVEEFIRTVDPKILSYDHYALLYDEKTGTYPLREDYLRNLEIFAEASEKYGKPFYVFLLTIGHLYYRTINTYEDIAWQVYSAMAFNARGAQTFTYWTLLSNDPISKITYALVDRDGTKKPGWYAMQKVISEVRTFEDEFEKCSWEGVLPVRAPGKENPNFTNLAHPLLSHPLIAKVSADGDCIVGVFKREDGKSALLAMNFTDPQYGTEVKLNVSLRAEKAAVWQGGERKVVSADDMTLVLKSGQGVFLLAE